MRRRIFATLLMLPLLSCGCANPATKQPAAPPPAERAVSTTAAPRDPSAERLDAARSAFEMAFATLQQGGGTESGLVERACGWSERWRDSSLRVGRSEVERVAAEREHLRRIRELVGRELFRQSRQNVTRLDVAAVRYYIADAEDRFKRLMRRPS